MRLPPHLARFLKHSTPIYALSPHSDDVIWSLGGLLQELARDGYDITLVTIFSHSMFAYDKTLPPQEASAIRRAEDFVAARAAGLRRALSLDFPEAVLRDIPVTGIFDTGYRVPDYFMELLAGTLRQTIPAGATVLLPAGYGEHVDHLAVRSAALTLPQPKLIYADMPYAARSAHRASAHQFLHSEYRHIHIMLSPETIDAHMELFWLYRSQAAEQGAAEIAASLRKDGLSLWIPDPTKA